MSAGVLFVGIAVLDHVYAVEALPAGGMKHFATGHRLSPGGVAAMAAMAAARLGGRARLMTRLGEDEAGAALVKALSDAGVDMEPTRREEGATPVSAVFVDPAGERMLVNHKDASLFAAPPSEGEISVALKGAAAVMTDLRWPAGARATLEAARAAGLVSVLDFDLAPEAEAEALIPLASHVIFGRDALLALTGRGDPAAALAAIAGEGARLAVTCGADGVFWRGPEGGGRIAAPRVAAADTLGAGDVFHGAAALALAEGAAFPEALAFANAAAALKITRPSGPEGLPDRAEVEAFLEQAA